MHFYPFVIIIMLGCKFYFFSYRMYKLNIKRKKEKKLVWNKIRFYVDFIILACCFIIAVNIHPSNISNKIGDNNLNKSSENIEMIYIFHDYEWNEYIMNDTIHWASNSWDYLFDDEIPNDLKWEEKIDEWSVYIWDNFENKNNDNQLWNGKEYENDSLKDNQVSIGDIMSDLWMTDSEIKNSETTEYVDDDSLNIDIWDYIDKDNEYNNSIYVITEETWANNNSLIIEKFNDDWNLKIPWNNESLDNKVINDKYITNKKGDTNTEDKSLLVAKAFTFIEEWWVLPTLVPWNDLFFGGADETLSYTNGNSTSNNVVNNWYNNTESKKSGITIIEDYADCLTPWGYKIKHWESVLAYKQMDNAPNICNIERRFCRKWKLSGTYTQQWCSINGNYTYEQWWTTGTPTTIRWWETSTKQWETKGSYSYSKNEFKWGTRQNEGWTVSVKSSEIWWSFVFDGPNNSYTNFTGNGNNIRPEDPEVELTDRPHRDCTAPRWEKVRHWQFVQAFKHKNWFNDIPCEAQFRLCTVWNLMWTFTESSCKTWDTSFVDWVYGSPTRETYSKGKLDLIKDQLEYDEKKYNKDRRKIWWVENGDDLDELLYILDENY